MTKKERTARVRQLVTDHSVESLADLICQMEEEEDRAADSLRKRIRAEERKSVWREAAAWCREQGPCCLGAYMRGMEEFERRAEEGKP